MTPKEYEEMARKAEYVPLPQSTVDGSMTLENAPIDSNVNAIRSAANYSSTSDKSETDSAPLTDAQSQDLEQIRSAAMAIPPSAVLVGEGDYPISADRVIAYALCTEYGRLYRATAQAVATEWDKKTGGGSWNWFVTADPEFPGKPITKASLFRLAKENGWSPQEPTMSIWTELQPQIAHTEAHEYPLDALPPLIRNAIEEVCGFVQAPVALVAMSALAALSLAIQAHTDVQRDVKLEGPCSLFLCCIADSGERKTTCDNYFTAAVREYQARENAKAKQLLQAYETELRAWNSQSSGIQESIKSLAKAGRDTSSLTDQLHALDRDKPKAPRVPRLLYADAGPEALALHLVQDWPSGGVFSAEAGVVLGGHGMNRDAAMRNMARLNQLWDGRIAATDRVSAGSYGETVARLTMSLQVQEPTLRAFFDNTKGLARGTGFFARFLIAWPESTIGSRMYASSPDGWRALAEFNDRLTTILNTQASVDDDGVLTLSMLQLTAQAKSAWIKFHDAIEAEMATGRELFDLRDVGSKAADNVVRLATLLHVFANKIGSIDHDDIEASSRIITWHLLEAKRFLGELAMPPELANPLRLEKWMSEYCKREHTARVSTRNVQRNGPSGLRSKPIMMAAVNELVELGRVRLLREGQQKFIELHPALLGIAS
jgi:putative DNA primase/helicase